MQQENTGFALLAQLAHALHDRDLHLIYTVTQVTQVFYIHTSNITNTPLSRPDAVGTLES